RSGRALPRHDDDPAWRARSVKAQDQLEKRGLERLRQFAVTAAESPFQLFLEKPKLGRRHKAIVSVVEVRGAFLVSDDVVEGGQSPGDRVVPADGFTLP